MYNALYYACFIEETLAVASAVKAGADKVAGITRERYVNRLVWLRALSRFHIFTKQDDRRKLSFIRISNVLENLRLDSSDGTVRKQPFCIVLTGPPGCGKTGTAMRIAAQLMRARHGNFYSTDIVTLNETDEFQSEYRTNHKVVIFDDVGAEKPSAQVANPWRKVIDFVNNIRKTALNPNLELKGNVYIEPELVIITTNLKVEGKFSIAHYMACPDAIMRRLSHAVVLDPDFETCRHARMIRVGAGLESRVYKSGIDYDRNMESKTILDFIEEASLDFVIHQKEQEVFVGKINSIFDPPRTSNNALKAFVDDVIRPNWSTKYRLPLDLEKGLAWYERFGRLFCFEEEQELLEAQSGVESLPLTLDLKDRNSMGKELYLQQNFNYLHYFILEENLRESIMYCPNRHGFISYDEVVVLPEFSHSYERIHHLNVLPFEYTLGELRQEADRQFEEFTALQDSSLDCRSQDDGDTLSILRREDTIFPEQPPCKGYRRKISVFQYSEANIAFPMKGFMCNPAKDDQYMRELLDTQPKSHQLVLREWVNEAGIGDLVFYHRGKDDIPCFLVVEIKSHNAEVACAQARKYGNELLRQLNLRFIGQKKVMAIGMTPDAYELIHIFGADTATRELATQAFEKWFQNFTKRCGALRESSDSNEL